MHDTLTGLPNRALFIDRLDQALASGRRRSTTVAVLFIDLDRFKVVNDSRGHAAGDSVLVSIADRVISVLRPGDTLARFGGDEFTVLCPDLDSPRGAVTVADRLSEVVRKPIDLDGAEMVLTASIGIAIAGEHDLSGETLIRNADAAMYRAKESGRARWLLFDQGIHQRAVERLETEVSLRRSVDTGVDFNLDYQPIVVGHDGRLAGFEALLRL